MNESGKWAGKPKTKQVIALGIVTLYVMGVLLIWIASPNLEFESYPSECPEDSRNCSRIAPEPHRATGDDGLHVAASKEEVLEFIEQWVESQPRTQIITKSQEAGYIHSVFQSFVWRFSDDMLFHVGCDNGTAEIWIHSESRLGVGDMNVNPNRVVSFADEAEQHQWSGDECFD